jgi:DNA-binding beta-propeller fold protein YncE
MTLREFATGLKFPEGPVAMDDGSVIVVEIEAGRITRVKPDGKTQVVAKPGGGPNGLAIGPDGALYVCNNGSNFEFHKRQGLNIPGPHAGRAQGRAHRAGEHLHRQGRSDLRFLRRRSLIAPNDIVFDTQGGFWFTDHASNTAQARSHGALYYAKADGSKIVKGSARTDHAQRCRSLAGRHDGLLRRDDAGAVMVAAARRSRASRARWKGSRRACSWVRFRVLPISIRWACRPTAECAARRSSRAASPPSGRARKK